VSKTGQLSLLRTVYKLFILQKKAAFKGKVDVEWVQRYIQAIVRKQRKMSSAFWGEQLFYQRRG
jgi:hypothetical protein